MLMEILLGSVLLLSGMLCIGPWAETQYTPIVYGAGSIFLLLGLVLFFSAVHSCALSTCLAVLGIH
jgi:hypothetical protein